MTHSNEPQPITFDKIACGGTYYGVKICDLGVDGEDGMFAFTDDTRRAIAAARAHIRNFHGETADFIETKPVRNVQLYDRCGCPAGIADDDKGDDCIHFGLPPCRDEFCWMSERCEPDAVNAHTVIEMEWGC